MRRGFRVTYDIITPESAVEGDTAENGFVEPRFNIQVPIEEVQGKASDADYGWTLAEAERFLGRGGMEDAGSWFTSADGSTDYRTGAVTRYALHPPENVTGASYRRLQRIFCF